MNNKYTGKNLVSKSPNEVQKGAQRRQSTAANLSVHIEHYDKHGHEWRIFPISKSSIWKTVLIFNSSSAILNEYIFEILI